MFANRRGALPLVLRVGRHFTRSVRVLASPSGDLYEVLGVPRDATQAQIKAAYYRLSMHHHPDRNDNSPESAKRFTGINEAYRVLGNSHLRRAYDRPFDSYSAGGSSLKNESRRRGPTDYHAHSSSDEFYQRHYGDARERELRRKKLKELYDQQWHGAQSGTSVAGLAVLGMVLLAYLWR